MMIEGIEVQYRATFESGGAANLTSDNKYDYSSVFRIKHAIAYGHFRLYNGKVNIILYTILPEIPKIQGFQVIPKLVSDYVLSL